MEKKNFIVLLKENDKKEKIIESVIAYDDEIYKKIKENYSNNDYIFSDYADYILGEKLNYYVNGKRLTDYEIYLKFGDKLLEKGLKYNDQGEPVLMTDDEKMLAGEIEIKEGYEIINNKLVPIPYFNLKKQYNENKKELLESLKRNLSEKKDDLLNNSIIILKENKFQNKLDKESLSNLIEYDIPIEWRTIDNKLISLTKEEGVLLLKKSEEIKQNILKEYWEKTFKLEKMIEENKPLDNLINFIEDYCKKSIDTNFASEENNEHQINENDIYQVPKSSPYSGLLPENEIKSLRERKNIKTKKKN